MIMAFIGFTIVGLGAGFLAGLLGVSGGLLTVPCLLFMFKQLNFPSVHLMQLAIGTSLAAMVFNSISSTYSHHREKGVNWKMVKSMIPGLILGCLLGAFVGHLLPGAILQLIFGVFVIFLGIYFYRFKGIAKLKSHEVPTVFKLNSYGFWVSAFSNILGIGGGTMMVPVFVRFKFPMKMAIGSSAATGFLISLTGAISYLYFGFGETFYEHTQGYVYIPAFVILAVTTFITAPYGAKIAHKLASDKLKQYFAMALITLGIIMLIR